MRVALYLLFWLNRPYVKDGQWTFGLFDMWTKKAKVAKQSVHIPCWDRCDCPAGRKAEPAKMHHLH